MPIFWRIGDVSLAGSAYLELSSVLSVLLPFIVPCALLAFPALLKTSRKNLVTALLLSLLVLIGAELILKVPFWPLDRAVLYVEFPLVILAGITLSGRQNSQWLILLAGCWTLWQSVFMMKLPFLYGPSWPWQFYADRIADMPAIGLTPSPAGWVLTVLLFSACVAVATFVIVRRPENVG
jgi:hypothetical protein